MAGSVDGEAGVRRMLELFARAIDDTLSGLGCPGLGALDASYLARAERVAV